MAVNNERKKGVRRAEWVVVGVHPNWRSKLLSFWTFLLVVQRCDTTADYKGLLVWYSYCSTEAVPSWVQCEPNSLQISSYERCKFPYIDASGNSAISILLPQDFGGDHRRLFKYKGNSWFGCANGLLACSPNPIVIEIRDKGKEVVTTWRHQRTVKVRMHIRRPLQVITGVAT